MCQKVTSQKKRCIFAGGIFKGKMPHFRWINQCKLLTVIFLVSEGASVSSCDDTITTVESDTFKYFRTQFDSVSNNRISVEVRDIEGKQVVGSNLFGISTSLPMPGKKGGRWGERGRESGKEGEFLFWLLRGAVMVRSSSTSRPQQV